MDFDGQLDAEGGHHALRVIAGRGGLDDAGDAIRKHPGE